MLFLTIEFLSRDVKGPFVAKIDTQAFKLYGIPRDCVQDAINKLDKNLQGIYFLVNTEERGKGRYLYIGQTKQGPERLIDHRVKKPEWNMAYMKRRMGNALIKELVAKRGEERRKALLLHHPKAKQRLHQRSALDLVLGAAAMSARVSQEAMDAFDEFEDKMRECEREKEEGQELV